MSKTPTDWSKIRMEYVLKRTPYRQLAEKYGVNFKTLSRKAKAEGWVQLSTQNADMVSTAAKQQAADAGVDYARQLYEAGMKILDNVNSLLNLDEALAPRDVKSLSSTLLDLKNLYGLDADAGGDAPESGEGIEVRFVARTKGAAR